MVFPFMGSGEIFPLINDLMICKCITYKCVNNDAVVQHSHMRQSGASDLFKKLFNISRKYINSFVTEFPII